MNKIFIGITFLFLLTCACTDNTPDPFYERLDFKHDAQRYLSFDPDLEKSIMAKEIIILPVIKDNKRFEITIENFIGKLIYDEHYKTDYSTYAHFLEALTLNDIFIKSYLIDSIKYTAAIDSNYYGYVNTNHRIFQEYLANGFQFILQKYFELENEDKVIYRLKLTDLPINHNVFYKIMYENKYLGGTDCVTGQTRFGKLR